MKKIENKLIGKFNTMEYGMLRLVASRAELIYMLPKSGVLNLVGDSLNNFKLHDVLDNKLNSLNNLGFATNLHIVEVEQTDTNIPYPELHVYGDIIVSPTYTNFAEGTSEKSMLNMLQESNLGLSCICNVVNGDEAQYFVLKTLNVYIKNESDKPLPTNLIVC